MTRHARACSAIGAAALLLLLLAAAGARADARADYEARATRNDATTDLILTALKRICLHLSAPDARPCPGKDPMAETASLLQRIGAGDAATDERVVPELATAIAALQAQRQQRQQAGERLAAGDAEGAASAESLAWRQLVQAASHVAFVDLLLGTAPAPEAPTGKRRP